MEILHSALWVSNLERTMSFYIDCLGLEKTHEFESGDGTKNVYVAGENGTEIQFKYDPDCDLPTSLGGFDHIALTVEDTDAAVQRLVEKGPCTLRRGPLYSHVVDGRIAFIEDPEGYGIELIED